MKYKAIGIIAAIVAVAAFAAIAVAPVPMAHADSNTQGDVCSGNDQGGCQGLQGNQDVETDNIEVSFG
jgi:hypothetical protein